MGTTHDYTPANLRDFCHKDTARLRTALAIKIRSKMPANAPDVETLIKNWDREFALMPERAPEMTLKGTCFDDYESFKAKYQQLDITLRNQAMGLDAVYNVRTVFKHDHASGTCEIVMTVAVKRSKVPEPAATTTEAHVTCP